MYVHTHTHAHRRRQAETHSPRQRNLLPVLAIFCLNLNFELFFVFNSACTCCACFRIQNVTDANDTSDGINKTTNTKLAQNVFQAKIKTAKKRSLRASEPPCSTHSKTANLPTHTHTDTHTRGEAKRTRARSLTRTLSTRAHTHTHIHARSMLDRAPQQFVGYARDTHTHTHICANLLTELVPTQTLAHETQWESGRARF